MQHAPMAPEAAEREKRSAALSSVAAAVLLTLLKLGVGLVTNSLGMLSEALHSGLDLLAAAVTYLAVRYASLPPDPGHPYGHGKMENLSALIESLLLFITCGWIVWEAVDRLWFNPVTVEPSLMAFGVMGISIVVDYGRSRMLLRMAKKHRSQALEADALHFSTDIWSSVVVIFGLGALYIALSLPEDSVLRPWLEKADSIAALGVSAIVIYVSYELGSRAVNVLLDAGDEPLTSGIRTALRSLPGVQEVRGLRLRHSGPDLFVDMNLAVESSLTMEDTLLLRKEVESAVHASAEHATVSIEFVPLQAVAGDSISYLRSLAVAFGLHPHAVEALELDAGEGQERKRLVELHVEMPPQLTLGEAHAQVDAFEKRVKEQMPGVLIVTHLEPLAEGKGEVGRDDNPRDALVPQREARYIENVVQEVLLEEKSVKDCHNMLLSTSGDMQYLSFHCRMPADTTVIAAHEVATRVQAALHKRLPGLKRVTVHMEPLLSGQ